MDRERDMNREDEIGRSDAEMIGADEELDEVDELEDIDEDEEDVEDK